MSDVPCNGCTACCKNDLVFLRDDDELARYAVREAVHPLTGEIGWALQHSPEGGCIYRVEGMGCTIHGRQPMVCREFDCRDVLIRLMSLPRPERRRLQKKFDRMHLLSAEVVQAARDRL